MFSKSLFHSLCQTASDGFWICLLFSDAAVCSVCLCVLNVQMTEAENSVVHSLWYEPPWVVGGSWYSACVCHAVLYGSQFRLPLSSLFSSLWFLLPINIVNCFTLSLFLISFGYLLFIYTWEHTQRKREQGGKRETLGKRERRLVQSKGSKTDVIISKGQNLNPKTWFRLLRQLWQVLSFY